MTTRRIDPWDNLPDPTRPRRARAVLIALAAALIVGAITAGIVLVRGGHSEADQSGESGIAVVQSAATPTPQATTTAPESGPQSEEYSYNPDVESNPEYGERAREVIRLVAIRWFDWREGTEWPEIDARMNGWMTIGLRAMISNEPDMQTAGIAPENRRVKDVEYHPTKEGDGEDLGTWEGSITVTLRPDGTEWTDKDLTTVDVKVVAVMTDYGWQVSEWTPGRG